MYFTSEAWERIMLKKKTTAAELEGIAKLPDDALETEQQADGSVKAVPAGTAVDQEIDEDRIITADDLVTEPELPDNSQLCKFCTAEIGDDGLCTNCGRLPE